MGCGGTGWRFSAGGDGMIGCQIVCGGCNDCKPKENETAKTIRIVFDGPPGPEAGRFVEVEDEKGCSIDAGEWRKRDDGYWELVLDLERMVKP